MITACMEYNIFAFINVDIMLFAWNQRAIFLISVLTWEIKLVRLSPLARPAVSSANISLNKFDAL